MSGSSLEVPCGLWYVGEWAGPSASRIVTLHGLHEESASMVGSGPTRLLVSPGAEHPQKNTNTPHATWNGNALYLYFIVWFCFFFLNYKCIIQEMEKSKSYKNENKYNPTTQE